MELFALSVPWILLLLVIVVIGLLVFKRWRASVCLFLLVVAVNWYFQTIPFNLSHGYDADGELKVLSFNCNLSPKSEDVAERREGVISFIREQDADVVFLAENFIVKEDTVWLMLQDMYPYRSFQKNAVGNHLYSKYPIVSDTTYKEKGKGYGITCCRIMVDRVLVDVSGVHLSSNNYNEHHEYMTPDSVANSEQARRYLGNIVTAGEYRAKEAELLNDNLNLNPSTGSGQALPAIVMGDFNDVSGSPTMRILESAGFKDAWWEGGLGYGATIHNPLPFRIDHILYNNGLKLKCVGSISEKKLSDHNALVAAFLIKE